MPSPDVQAFLDAWGNLPQNYVPQYDFAMLENGPQGTGTYAFPASPQRQQQFRSRFTGEPVATAGTDEFYQGSGVPDNAELLGGSYGKEPIDPKYAQDLDIWNKFIQAGNLNDDDFHGFVANVFGNSFTLPAAFAGAAMGANAGAAASGGSTASGLGVKAATTGLGLTQNPSGGGVGGALGSLAGATTGIPGASTVGGIAGGLAGGALAASLASGGSGSTPQTTAQSGPGAGMTPSGTSTAATLGQPGTQPDLSDEDMLTQLRRFGLAGVQPRQGLVGAGLTEAEQAANASSQRLLTGLRSQITQLRQGLQGQFAQASRALGPAGSKMIQGAQGSALAQAGGQLSNLLQQGGAKGQSQLLSVLQGLKPGLVTALQAPNTTITQGPSDFSGLTSLLTGAGALNRAVPGGLSKLLGLASDDTEGSDLGTGGFSPDITTDQLSALAQGTNAETGKGLLDALSADDLYTLYGP